MTTLAQPFSLLAPPPPIPLGPRQPGTVGPWRLQGVIGRGRRTTVYRAAPLELPLDREGDYAVKLANPNVGSPVRAMLETEAAVGSVISHPHVVPVLAWQTDGPTPYLVMPFLSGITLRRQLEASVTLPLRMAIWWMRQTAEALLALHDAGWIHGDVKPENVMLNQAGHATLIDLGFVRPIDAPTGTAALMGTPAYAAPERLQKAPLCLPASDVYSLGTMAYELLAGKRPELIGSSSRLGNISRKLLNHRTDCPLPIAELVAAMLRQQPDRRPSLPEIVDVLLGWELETLVRDLTD